MKLGQYASPIYAGAKSSKGKDHQVKQSKAFNRSMPLIKGGILAISEAKEMKELDTKTLIHDAWQIRKKHFPNEIMFDYPIHTESITLTGLACALDCAHCGGHYLKAMRNVEEIRIHGAMNSNFPFRSALISGGCTLEGKVPFSEHLDFLRQLKQGVRLNFHVGLINDTEVGLLRDLADVVSFDFVADQAAIEEVYGLERGPEDYARVYQALRTVVRVIPHITLGLRGGEWSGEEKALVELQNLGVEGIIFNVFIPTPETHYASRQAPPVEEVIRFLAQARIRFPEIPLALGCMRPKGKYRLVLDEAAVALGLNRLVIPTPGARRLAEEIGLRVIHGEECCAL